MRSKSLQKSILFLSVASLILLLAACGSSASQATPTLESATVAPATSEPASVPTAPPASGDEAYPPPAAAEVVQPYPSGEEAALPPVAPPQAYPPPAETFQEPRFRFDGPISAAATTITGQAPPNTSLAIMDVTYNGGLLGVGRSDGNGRFSIPVSGLVAGNRIGLGIGELAPDQTIEQMAEYYFPYRGEGFMNIPNVGIFFDTILINP